MKKIYRQLMVILSATSLVQAMPGTAHRSLGELLLDTPVEKGGSMGISREKVKAISDWIDNPTQKTGQYRVNSLDGQPKVTPSNHQNIRHNPVRAAKALSGTGSVDPAVLNQTRLHKIADVAASKANAVDGWELTPKMKKQAQKILKYVEKHKRLPKRLPPWLDPSGPLLNLDDAAKAGSAAAKSGSKAVQTTDDAARAGSKVASGADDAARAAGETAEQAGKVAGKLGKVAGKAAKIAGPVALVIEGGIRGKQAYDTEQDYKNGEITNEKRIKNHSRNGGQLVGGTGGAAGGAWGGAAIGTAVCPGVGTVIGGVVGGIAGGLGGDKLGGMAGEAGAEAWISREEIKRKAIDAAADMEESWNQTVDGVSDWWGNAIANWRK